VQKPAGLVLMAVVLAGVSCSLPACERETRPFRDLPAAAAPQQGRTRTDLSAGAPPPPVATTSPYQKNAWGQSEGKRLFTSYNCVGCHANGGGGIGPALMDDEWRYGFQPGDIYDAIVQGLPNGMPSFRNKIPDHQVWQLVAYVQSMSGQNPIDASPGRSDHLYTGRPPELITPFRQPTVTGHK
jgi:cytochrome c oxidase cbb3-type subunit 3